MVYYHCVASVFRLKSNATRSILYVKQEVQPWFHLTRAPLSTKFDVFPTWLVEKLLWETLCFKHLHNFIPDMTTLSLGLHDALYCLYAGGAHCWTGFIGDIIIKGNEYKNMPHFPDYVSPFFCLLCVGLWCKIPLNCIASCGCNGTECLISRNMNTFAHHCWSGVKVLSIVRKVAQPH